MIKYKLAEFLPDCPWPWQSFVRHCMTQCPKDQKVEQFVDQQLLERYKCTIIDVDDYAVFEEDELYTLFLIEWT